MSSLPTSAPACEVCGFDAAAWAPAAADKTLRDLGQLWLGVLDGIDPELGNERPAPDRWSILELADHVRGVLANARVVVDLARADARADPDPGADVPFAPTVDAGAHRRFAAVAAVLDELDAEGRLLFDAVRDLDPDQRDQAARVGGKDLDTGWAVHDALHESFHHLRDAGRLRVELGDGVASQSGSVAALHAGPGGVPKPSVPQVQLTARGVAGDRQHDTLNHGRPFQAVCLWGTGVIDGLVAEGHPIFPGAAGENLTLAGIDWPSLRPGAFVHVGDEVVLELSAYAVPCSKNAGWFADGDFRRILHSAHPGWSRLYASVVHPGGVRVGDTVLVERPVA